MTNIKISLGGFISSVIILTIFGLLAISFSFTGTGGFLLGAAFFQFLMFLSGLFGETDESAAEIEDLKEVLNQIYFETDCSDEQKELIEDAIYMDLEKDMKVIITPVDREIVEKLQKASGLTKENAEK